MTAFQRTLIVALGLAASASFAQSSRNVPPSWANEIAQPFVSSVSRAEVQAQVQTARADGTLNAFDSLADLQIARHGETTHPFVALVRDDAGRMSPATGGVSRAQVRAEFEAARRSGAHNPFDSLSELNPAPRQAGTRSAAVAAK
jgi:hypothetical protein